MLVDCKHFGIGRRRRKEANFFGCDCGSAEKGADNARPNLSSPYTLPKLRREHSKKTRIVGGYTPKVRPWMALLELKPKPKLATRNFGGAQKNAQCGGALINKVFLNFGVKIQFSSLFEANLEIHSRKAIFHLATDKSRALCFEHQLVRVVKYAV